MKLTIPELSLVVLIGASGSGKSTFAREHFAPTEVLSSDFFRGLVADDENDQSATATAFETLHFVAAKRLEAGRLTVIDATNVQQYARKPLIALARAYHALPVAIVFSLPEALCQERNRSRPDRDFGPHVVRNQTRDLRRSLRGLPREGFRYVYVLDSAEKVDAATIERQRLWNNRKDEHGPFDIIGDVHGCYDELTTLLDRLGYELPSGDGTTLRHPDGRKAIFLGDLVDRGPKVPAVLRLVMDAVEAETALCVIGNHEWKLVRALKGRNVQVAHGLAESLEQLEAESAEFRERVVPFLDGMISHYVLDDGRLVVAHAGLKAEMHGRGSGRVRDFAMYGDKTGEIDEFGLPVRLNWAADYRGEAMVVYGHTPVPEAEWLNNTIDVDTGCVFGGKLTAVRYPERELVSVPAARVYTAPARPFLPEAEQVLTAQQRHDEVLDIADVIGKRIIHTRLQQNVTIREENAITALEAMSRFAVDPRWLIYLPPTMSPAETTSVEGLLEHPAEAFGYFRHAGVPRLVCEEKHMGSRAVVIACRDPEAARSRFGVADGSSGIVYTRTGRRFFDDAALEAELLARVNAAMEAAGLWAELETDWVCLDAELMPWSAKAQELLRQQYAAVGAAAAAALPSASELLGQATQRGLELNDVRDRVALRQEQAEAFVDAYRRYCWPVESLVDLKLAPFHLLATEGKAHTDKAHRWHMESLHRLTAADPELLLATPYREVDVTDPDSEAAAVAWWKDLTDAGGEGMVVKPLDFISRGRRGLVQPALKSRGREYLRLIYGPEYTTPENLERLRARGVSAKRSLALREFALGAEAMERFVRHEPLRRVHECVFGVLALESEPVDPRL